MDIEDFPNCCTMDVICGVERGKHNGMMEVAENAEELESYIMATMGFGEHDEIDEYQVADLNGHAAIVITTNSTQHFAIKVLNELGFGHSPWLGKKNHPEAPVRIWWKHIEAAKEEWGERLLVGDANNPAAVEAKRLAEIAADKVRKEAREKRLASWPIKW